MVAVPATTRFCWTHVAQMTLLQPSVGSPDFWAGSGFEDKLLQAQGDFSLNAGQHSVTYLPNDETTATVCPSLPTRWKPKSISTACTSTSCRAALRFDQWSMKTRRSPIPPPRVAAIWFNKHIVVASLLGTFPSDIGGSRYVSRSVKQLSVGLTWAAVLFR